MYVLDNLIFQNNCDISREKVFFYVGHCSFNIKLKKKIRKSTNVFQNVVILKTVYSLLDAKYTWLLLAVILQPHGSLEGCWSHETTKCNIAQCYEVNPWLQKSHPGFRHLSVILFFYLWEGGIFKSWIANTQ
jgi:hypothetical protein